MKLNEAYRLITEQLGRVIVGQQQVIEELLVAMFARGHCLLVGVPGLAKTLMIRTLADALSLDFSRIQFTPDLMPSDITGTEVIQEDKRSGHAGVQVSQGPDLRQRDPGRRDQPHAAQDAGGPAGGDAGISDHRRRHAAPRWPSRFSCWPRKTPSSTKGPIRCPRPSWTASCSTSSSIIPDEEEELEIVKRTTADVAVQVTPTLDGPQILALQKIVRRVPVADHVVRYALQLTRLHAAATRAESPDFVRDYVQWGAGPRASQYLVLGAKARAVLHGRFYAGCDDIRAVAFPVLRHRIMTNFNAEAEGIKTDEIIRRLIDSRGDRRRDRPEGAETVKGQGGQQHVAVPNAFVGRCQPYESQLGHAQNTSIRKSGPPAGLAVARPADRGRLRGGRASQSLPRLLHRVRRTSRVRPGRRPPLSRLEGVRPHRQVLPEAVRGRDQPRLPVAGGHQREHGYRSAAAPMSKLEYAKCAAAALAYLVLQQQDSVGLVTFDHEIRALVRPSSNASHIKQILHVMEHSPAERKTATGADLPRPGRTLQEARHRHGAQRPVRRRRRDDGRPEALPPPPPRGGPAARARPGRAGFPLPADHAVPRPGAAARGAGRAAGAAEGVSGRIRPFPAAAEAGLPHAPHRLRAGADRSIVGSRAVSYLASRRE